MKGHPRLRDLAREEFKLAAETIGIEGRGSFYESTGVVRDIIQNHLLQLLALTASQERPNFPRISLNDR